MYSFVEDKFYFISCLLWHPSQLVAKLPDQCLTPRKI